MSSPDISTKITAAPSQRVAWGNVVRLRPWSAAEQRTALESLLSACEADPRGTELAGCVREILQRP